MASIEELVPLVAETISSVPSNEFTTYAFMQTFARFQERAYVETLYANLHHPAGPFAAVKDLLESALERSEKAKVLRDSARDVDMFGLPGITKLWQRKDG